MVKNKFILDATAGYRMMWFNKKHPNCIYLDQRPECEPDIVGDFRDLKEFPDETFKLIVWDPPHILRGSYKSCISDMSKNFGLLRPETWTWDLSKGFVELWRVLKQYGILIFKWSTSYISSAQILKLFPEKPLFYQVSSNKYKSLKGKSKKSQTLWFCFMKIPEEN